MGYSGNGPTRAIGIDYMPTGTKGIWAIGRCQVTRPAAAVDAGKAKDEPETESASEGGDTRSETGGNWDDAPQKAQSIWLVRAEPVYDDIPIIEAAGPRFAAVQELARAIETYRRTPPAQAIEHLKNDVIHGSSDISRWALRALGQLPVEQADPVFNEFIRDGSIPALRARLALDEVFGKRRLGIQVPNRPDPGAHDVAALLRRGLRTPLVPDDQAWLQGHYRALNPILQSLVCDLLMPPSTSQAPATGPAFTGP